MEKIREKLSRFMYGRYGNDSLNSFMLALYLVLAAASLFVGNSIAANIIRIILTALIVLIFLRMFSRNYSARRKENEIFKKAWRPVKSEAILTKNRLRDIKGFRYRKCRKCRAVLRLPRKRGKHTVKCPCCGERFDVRVIF
jgi:predicted membrane protein